MAEYTPEPVPVSLFEQAIERREEALREYLFRELLRVSNAVELTEQEIASAVADIATNTTDIATNAANIAAYSTSLFNSIKVTIFTASGTLTADSKMRWCEVWGWGGGGGGGGVPASGGATVCASSGGNGGAKAYLIANRATIGASQTVTIGNGGNGGAAGQNNGTAGSATTLGSLLSAAGGEGGISAAAAAAVGPVPPACSQSATGTVKGWTYRAGMTAYSTTSGFAIEGNSGSGELGAAIISTVNAVGTNANANTGAGGAGVVLTASQAAQAGGNGGSGFMIVKEYL